MESTNGLSIIRSESLTEFAQAFLKAQREMGTAKKGKNNPFFKSRYADLAEVVSVVKDPLNDHGIAYLQVPMTGERGPRVMTVLLHESGEFLGGFCEYPAQKDDAQGYGSAITYGRRYSLQGICGVPADDDDGNAASGKSDPAAYSKEMVKDFPQGELLHGTLLGVINSHPKQAKIATPNGDASYDFFFHPDQIMSLVGKPVSYRYQRKSQRFVLEEIQEDLPQIPVEVSKPVPTVTTSASTLDDDFEAKYIRGTVEKVQEKFTKKGAPYAYLTISGVNGNYWHSPATIGVDDYAALDSQEVFYTKEENPSKDGKRTFTTFTEIIPADIFEQAMAEKRAQLNQELDAIAEAES